MNNKAPGFSQVEISKHLLYNSVEGKRRYPELQKLHLAEDDN